MSCAAPDQGFEIPAGVDVASQAVVQGKVCAGNEPVAGAYVRLLDASGEFTAEVVTSPEGLFRFFAAPGSWPLRALSRHGNGELAVDAARGINDVALSVAVA